MPIEDFHALVNLAMTQSENTMRPVIEKELLHYDILFSLDKAGLLDSLVFQGGTALRLCYGANRLSEDLDFAGGSDFNASDLENIKNCVETYIGKRYGLEVYVKEPNHLPDEKGRSTIKVDKWQIRIVTSPERPDIPKQMIKLEVASVPAYTSQAKPLYANYDFLPDGYADTLVMTESLDEIMADKLVAFPCCQKYIRYRDLWDLQWLRKHKATLNIDLVQKKVKDYKVENYSEQVRLMIDKLPEIIHGEAFKAQMSRFIPMSSQESTLMKDKFYGFLEAEIREMLSTILESC